jgi:hypothetical protein
MLNILKVILIETVYECKTPVDVAQLCISPKLGISSFVLRECCRHFLWILNVINDYFLLKS